MPSPMSRQAGRKERSFVDLLAMLWFVIDGLTHLGMEGGYVLLAFGGTANKADSFNGFLWREYARADRRWAVRDPTILSLELLTVVVLGPLCLLLAYAIYSRKPWRHALQLVISVCELYGGWMTFAPEWLDGSPNLCCQDDPVLLYIYLAFMNGLWVLIPAVLAWESIGFIVDACARAKTEHGSGTPSDRALRCPWGPALQLHYICAAALGLYVILVPLVLFGMSDPRNVPVGTYDALDWKGWVAASDSE
mmetsp:Transcript_9944/g.28244  ORF Transcript_9944/g.28244 Transcript_9944/m.28244 type:complete len:250 (-) Transcript_9944:106-855(-)